jgi:hypothetical protein
MPTDEPKWEDQEETIVSFAQVPPKPSTEGQPPGATAAGDEDATIVAPQKPARAGLPEEHTVVAGERPVAEQVDLLAWLVISRTPSVRRGQIFNLDKLRNDIGRGAGVAVFLNDPAAGQQHATVKYEIAPDGTPQFVLYDLASTNGTFLNGQRIASPAVLKDGDRIRLGDTELAFKRL